MGAAQTPPVAAVITVSDRSSTGEREDRSGPIAVEALRAHGWDVRAAVVPDGADSVADAVRAAIAEGATVVITTGGTGIGPRDRTPEGTRQVIDREVPGISQVLIADGLTATPHAVLSRGIAGVVDEPPALVVNLPGSTGGVRDGVRVLIPLLDHAVAQLSGQDH